MSGTFDYDVFLSHNQADKPRVRRLAERLRARLGCVSGSMNRSSKIHLMISVLSLYPHSLVENPSSRGALELSSPLEQPPI